MRTETLVNTFLKRAKQQGKTLTHLQVQKLVYFLNGYYLAEHNTPLVEEPFQAWQYGPVLRTLYDALKSYGSAAISAYLPTVNKNTLEKQYFVVVESDEKFWPVFNRVWDKYGHLNGPKLSELSHEKGAPWEQTPDLYQIIDNRLIKSYFASKVLD